MRRDALTGDWVTVAAARQLRAFLPPAHLDPLAPQSASNPSEIPDLFDVAVFENRSPAFGPSTQAPDAPESLAWLSEPGWGRVAASLGRCEVVCFSPESTGSLGELPAVRVRTIIEAWAHRTSALSALPHVQQVFPFENRGEKVGVTLHHPHGQIYAYPYVTPRTQAMLAQARAFGPGLFSEILAQELAGERVLIRGEHWSAFVPFATHWPYEIHLMPHRHIPDLAATDEAERTELAVILPRLLRACDALFGGQLPYIAAWHQAPVHEGRDDLRLHLQITSPQRGADRMKFTAGSEAAMGAWVGDVEPERAAADLREALTRSDASWAVGTPQVEAVRPGSSLASMPRKGTTS